MSEEQEGKTEPAGAVAYESETFRLVIKEISGATRYLVYRLSNGGEVPRTLLGSGTASDPRSAIASARRLAIQLAL